MRVEDFTLQRGYDGSEFLTFAKGPIQGVLSVKTRLVVRLCQHEMASHD